MYKPYYVIEYSASSCLLDIKVNDVSVKHTNLKGYTSNVIPVNLVIPESGRQQVSYNILPLLGETALREDATFSASVCLYDAGGDVIQKQDEINTFTMPENTTKIPLPVYKGERVFYADVPYKLDAWQNSQDLSKIEKLRVLVDSAYRKIEEIISNSQYNLYAEMVQKREDNIATCFYLSEEEKKERLTELIELFESGFKIVPVSEKDFMFIYGYNKLVSLKKQDGSSALLLKNANTGQKLTLDIKLHLEQGSKELTII